MKPWINVLVSLALVGCATAPPPQRTLALFHDRLFSAPSEHIGAEDLFTLSPEMKRYLDSRILPDVRSKGGPVALFDALYSKGQLKLEYDSSRTFNAAEAFTARSGNCLSLVIMTAAFAKEMSLPVTFQSAQLDDTWGRSGDIHFFIGHVNVTLGSGQSVVNKKTNLVVRREENDLTIDFLLPREIRGLNTRVVDEDTIVAMYLNNRAAEAFVQGKQDDAYWWARAAITQDPKFISAYNTLGVIYKHHGNLQEAQQVLALAMESAPRNTRVMSNMVQVLNDLGRTAESQALAKKLAQIEPDPPFSFFLEGMVAMRKGDYKTASKLFAREVDRAPYYHEFHFWLAAAYIGLGDTSRAETQLSLAMDTSTSRNSRDLYAAKLERIKALEVH